MKATTFSEIAQGVIADRKERGLDPHSTDRTMMDEYEDACLAFVYMDFADVRVRPIYEHHR